MTGIEEFARRYTAAWCSGDPERVAAHFSPAASLTINSGAPAVGRAAIAEAARGFMTAFPDLTVCLDEVRATEDGFEYRWTLTGTHTGPGGTGRAVCISGCEEWSMAADGLIARSRGRFDAEEYARQLNGGCGRAVPAGETPRATTRTA
jgi:uncharacterized protein (TIGR02246 family)